MLPTIPSDKKYLYLCHKELTTKKASWSFSWQIVYIQHRQLVKL